MEKTNEEEKKEKVKENAKKVPGKCPLQCRDKAQSHNAATLLQRESALRYP